MPVRPCLPASGLPLLPILLFGLLGCIGCFSNNTAEGQYVESRSSGRHQAFAAQDSANGLINLMRLRLVQFDDEAGGVVEFFKVGRYETFESKEDVVTQRSPEYFCTRITRGTVKNNVVAFQFIDSLHRGWQVTGSTADDLVQGRIERLNAAGNVVDNATNTSYLLPEDQAYFAVGGALETQLVLERVDTSVKTQQLECVDFRRQDELVLQLPGIPPPNYRAALVLTRAIMGTDNDNPLIGLSWDEAVTATLDDVDIFDEQRRIVVRIEPELLVDIGQGIAVGTVVIYEDLPDLTGVNKGVRNDQWDNLRYSRDHIEKLWAYTPTQLLVYNQSDDPVEKSPKDAQGHRSGVPLFEESGRQTGWSMVSFFATPLVVDDVDVLLVESLYDEPNSAAIMERVKDGCEFCYPKPPTLEELNGEPAPDCSPCDPIFPLLYL